MNFHQWLDDAMAIFMAFQSPELEILGLTTIFGNTSTEIATQNALRLVCNQLIFIFLCMMCFRCNFFWNMYIINECF